MLASVRRGIRFASTPAGRVAYSVAGSGPPLLYLPGWVSHLGLMWEMPAHRRFVEVLAREYTVVRYDRVGCGLSDRSRDVFTLESELAALDALIEHLGLDRYALLGSCEGGQVAAAHAARHPDAVAALLVYGSCARGDDLAPDPVKSSVLSLVRAHWGLGSRVLADIWLPDAPAETVAMFARLQRGAATAEMAAALLDMFYRMRVDDLLPAIRVPALVLHRRGSRAVRFELGRQMAALIPGAQLVALEGRMQPIYAEWDDAAVEAIRSFLREHARDVEGPTAKPITARERQVAALIATGLTNADIGRRLGVSVRTVDAHMEHLRNKLGVRTRAQIAVWSVNSGVGTGRPTAPASPAAR
jgi:pimeloyl-ACP methyl ester carboxylesterase/DNA-binding CsgD family transcriptional regulator